MTKAQTTYWIVIAVIVAGLLIMAFVNFYACEVRGLCTASGNYTTSLNSESDRQRASIFDSIAGTRTVEVERNELEDVGNYRIQISNSDRTGFIPAAERPVRY